MSDDVFNHQPLPNPADSIRLIQVKPQHGDSPLELCLSNHAVSDNLSYFAVSYTWGDGCLTEKVLIHGRPMMVTKNCYYALTQIKTRYPSAQSSQEPVYLWIDSICINQDDNNEKGHQVAMMGNIYFRATKVLACIGSHADNSQMLRTVLDNIKTLHPELYATKGTLRSGFWDQSAGTLGEAIGKLLYSDPQNSIIFNGNSGYQFRMACFDFANRSYWSRVWIIQEFTATTRSGNGLEILCGCDTFSKSEINLCFTIAGCCRYEGEYWVMTDLALYRDLRIDHCFKILMRLDGSKPVPLGDILFWMKDLFHCTKPEDRVYGLLSLIEWPNGLAPIQPVYTPSSVLDLATLLTSLNHASYERINEILRALGIHQDHELMRSLVETRIHDPNELGDHYGKFGSRSSEKLDTDVLTISVDDLGYLSASLNSSDNYFDGVVEQTAAMFQRPNSRVKLLFSGSEVAGLLCDEAQEGDVMIQYGAGLVVLRQNGHIGQYNLVGQGLLSCKFEFPKDLPLSIGALKRDLEYLKAKRVYHEELENHRHEIKSLEMEMEKARQPGQCDMQCLVELTAKPIEWVMFAGQSLSRSDDRDTKRLLERLHTKIHGEATLA